eukprot:scaffold114135_cov23-Tisochrysis_lutea.AAC.3
MRWAMKTHTLLPTPFLLIIPPIQHHSPPWLPPSLFHQFSSFFPDLLATPIDLLAGAVGVVTRLRHDVGAEGRAGHHHHHLAGMPSALGSDSADASRR